MAGRARVFLAHWRRQIAKGSNRDRKSVNDTADRVIQACIEMLKPHRPFYYRPADASSSDESPVLVGTEIIDIHDLHKLTARLEDDKKLNGADFKNTIVLLVDGSGTAIYTPVSHTEHTMFYCYWKKQQQTRWYIVTDLCGRILFVSAPYEGKLDDTKALDVTGFYKYVLVMQVVQFSWHALGGLRRRSPTTVWSIATSQTAAGRS